ncbi:hypothetical protein HNP46_002788 [Pseudomonas nitritireducens]|uniref:Uncharacterized protein n=1 Tax=Pseudomonas nitroreducens TaxID=46680 RepID=A0A7W7KKW4_PSENT|nr:hypothetical protein [Pseudomonas nitritireducens]MBB4863928.1 hypothetical protein [Pseudomonas nitritireducens]
MKALSVLIGLINRGDAVVALGALSLLSAAIVVSSVLLMGLSAG